MKHAALLSLLTLICSALASSAAADTSGSHTVDRTYVCATGYLGGIYQAQLELFGRVHDPVAGDREAYGELTTTPTWRLAGLGESWVEFSPPHCNPMTSRGVLTERGLRGGRVGGLGRTVNCQTPARAVVRIRGVFTRPTALRPYRILDQTYSRAESPATLTAIGLSTAKGRPIAVARIQNGKAFLFTSANCEED